MKPYSEALTILKSHSWDITWYNTYNYGYICHIAIYNPNFTPKYAIWFCPIFSKQLGNYLRVHVNIPYISEWDSINKHPVTRQIQKVRNPSGIIQNWGDFFEK